MSTGVRLRQAVLVAAELDPVATRLRDELGLGEPFADPGVGEFGLRNAVFALGDCFLEVVSPTRPGTAAGRYLERNGGDGGYMLIFQLDDLAAARERVSEMGIRVVWQIDLPDISGTHLHPADMRGAIVSLDRAEPPESWRWGGPDWTGRGGTGAPGRLSGATVAVPDADAVAARWGRVLGVEADDRELALDGGRIRFAEAAAGDGLVEVTVSVPGRDGGSTEIGGARFTFEESGNIRSP
ncbi:MAG: VOC family protein [Actinomycetota bacterium]|nr:VOC family protein [Actinomycetota bacterium]